MDTKQSYPTIKDFVLQQAHQKAFEELVLGLKDFEKEKSKIYQEKKGVLNGEFDKKQKDKMAARRIHKSSLINNCRMQKMQARHKVLEKIVQSSERNLAMKVVKSQEKYKDLLKGMIIEGLIKMLEPVIYVRCLKRDAQLVSSVLDDCKRKFADLLEKEGIQQSIGEIQLKLDERYSLEERQISANFTDERVTKSQQNNRCFGGVILTNEGGAIVCKNTLDTRIELAYQHLLPAIREQLFM